MNVAKDENLSKVQVSKLVKISICETVISAELSEKFQVPKCKFEFSEAVQDQGEEDGRAFPHQEDIPGVYDLEEASKGKVCKSELSQALGEAIKVPDVGASHKSEEAV